MQQPCLTLVPCAAGTRKSCDLLREALQQLRAARPELQVLEADAPELAGQQTILALDASRDCRASELLKSRRIKPAAVLYLPEAIAARKLLDPTKPIEAQWAGLRDGIVAIVAEKIDKLLGYLTEQAAYFQEMMPVIQRYLKELGAVETAGAPAEQQATLPATQAERLLLAANRFRNMFMRCDEITPPSDLSTMHDVFQDACMCMTYAVQHWERGEWQKALEYLEQAGHQAGPMLRQKAFAAKA